MNDKHFLIENYIGRRIRFYRLSKDCSMKKMASYLNISYQQLQKYEKGIDRVKASRLMDIATFLDVPISSFYPPSNFSSKNTNIGFDTENLVNNYILINSKEAREVIIKNIEIFVENGI